MSANAMGTANTQAAPRSPSSPDLLAFTAILSLLGVTCSNQALTQPATALPPPCTGPSASEERPEAKQPAATVAPAPGRTGNATEPQLKVLEFDCQKADAPVAGDHAGCVQSKIASGAVPNSPIRDWRGGGPEGSTWNAHDLRCHARLDMTCSGDLELSLKVGREELARVRMRATAGTLDCAYPLLHKKWEAALDRVTIPPFKTGIFRVEAYLVCNDPPAVLRADDHFVAGFAWGE
jgi:hypothetical protein